MNEYSLAKSAAGVFEAAAQQQRDTAETLQALKSAIRQFETKTYTLPGQVLHEVNQTLPDAAKNAAAEISSNWTEANTHAEQAAQVYKNAARWTPWRVAGLALLSTICGIGGMVLTAQHVLPNAEVVAALRMEEATLRAKIQQLSAKGGNATVVECYDTNRRKRLCVLVDESAKVSTKGYRVVMGY